MKTNKISVILAAMMLYGTCSYAATATVSVNFDQPITSPQQQAGGAELTINGGDTVTLFNTVLTDAAFTNNTFDTKTVESIPLDSTSTVPATAEGSSSAQTKPNVAAKKEVASGSLALASFYSPYLKVYSIPLSWTFFGKLKTDLSVPYIDRTLKQDGIEYSANGLGDISFGLDYSILNDEKWDVSTVLGATFPTGDVEAKGSKNGKTISVPLGSGAYSINLTQNVSYNLTDNIRTFGSGTFRYFTDADYINYATATDSGDYDCSTVVNSVIEPYCQKHEERGIIISGVVGSEYKFVDNMSITGRFSIVDVEGGKQSFNGKTLVSSNDSLLAGDVSATYKWRFYGNATVAVTGIFPAFTQFDPNVKNPEDRTWGVSGAFLTKF